MKKFIYAATLALAIGMTGCTSPEGGGTNITPVEEPDSPPATSTEPVSNVNNDFSYSELLDENGHIKGINVLDYIDLFQYENLTVPREVHYVSDETVQSEIDLITQQFQIINRVFDRPVEDGDLINIDFVGSIDEVEFEGGNTEGNGMQVTAGSSEFIGDFLTQLIGAMPGDTINVEVSFPEDYGVEELDGKPALFVTTINFIIEEAELTDEDVVEHLSDNFGWTTVEETRDGIRKYISDDAISTYVRESIFGHIESTVDIEALPATLTDFHERQATQDLRSQAELYQLEVEDFLSQFYSIDSIEEYLSESREDRLMEIAFMLMMQGIAEEVGIAPSAGDLEAYFLKNTGDADYSSYEEQYGLPFLKQYVLISMVLDHIVDNATLEE